MLTTPQLGEFFPDLDDERVESALALVHSRFSTNTFPSWPLAHPYRYLAHNGEINTVQGNRNWMRAREALLQLRLLPGDLERIFPICTPEASDSASFDEVLELLHLGGRSLPHAVLMMIPEAWEHHEAMDPTKRAFYRFHAALMEPWDGPASIAFTDGTVIGAVLDRNGLRPSRYWVTDDDLVIMASEVGVVDVDPAKVVRKGRLQPGTHVPGRHRPGPHRRRRGDQGRPWPTSTRTRTGSMPALMRLEDLPEREHVTYSHESVLRRQQVFGYTHEELQDHPGPDGQGRATSPSARWAPTRPSPCCRSARACCSTTSPSCSPRSPTRRSTPSARSWSRRSAPPSARRANLLDPAPASCRQVQLPFPVIDNDDLAKIVDVNADGDLPGFSARHA